MPVHADSGTSSRIVLVIATLTFMLFTFVASAVNIALPSIGEDLQLDAVTLSWVATAYLLSSAVFLVPFGRLADIYGKRRIFTSGIIIFTLASLLSGVAGMAGSGSMLIFFRVLQGVGVAMFAGTGVAWLTAISPANERGKVLGITSTAAYVGLALGPVLGGVLTQHLGWESIFFLIVPPGLAIIVVILRKLKGEWAEARGEKFDFAGSIIYILALVALVYGITLLPAQLGVWLVIGGAVGLAVFARWQMRIQNPVLNMDLFKKSRTFALSSLATLLEYSPMLAAAFFLSLHLQYVKGFNPESAGLILVTMPAISAILSPYAGRLSDRIEPRTIASIGMAFTTIGITIFVFLNETTRLELVIGTLILLGCGQALFSSPNTNAVMSSVPKTAYGVASAMVATTRQIGMSLGMGVAMLILAIYVGREQITPEYHPLLQEGMRTSFIILAIVCFIGIFVSLARGKIR